MKNTATLSTQASHRFQQTDTILMSQTLLRLARFLTNLIEEPVSPRFALHLLNASLAFFFLLTLGGSHWVCAVLLLTWAALALNGCKHARHSA